ncbi:GDSL-like lipase/acylhydrolase family protein [Stackebrandtia endophytica]|uniref:GDSL-like lipase/acylhydrolase family protein n=1 Tax=Stackebrandtia endophytica TaxID=1496996 RepID=A0A543B194_9ACTN|nr:SGNH/GDSL hydrolase family protein [Stackebrandtia endophytica]TQL78605.1 GDSL-like lipase/acylhydrolase family protein [Stackebrandtia endophytica]
MWLLRRLGASVAAVAVLVGLAGSAAPASAREPQLSYVALGDSYTAGSGGGDYQAEECRMSANSYPERLAELRDWSLRFDACAGARIQDVWDRQLEGLTTETRRITISVGGNDAGWADVVAACMMAEEPDCESRIDLAWANIGGSLYDQLRELYRGITDRAPNASVLVVGYPRLFAETECEDAPGLSVAEQQWINLAADHLNRTIMRAAFAERLGFVDVRGSFIGHAVCDPEPWIHGPSTTPGDSFHPNADGYSAYAEAVDWWW